MASHDRDARSTSARLATGGQRLVEPDFRLAPTTEPEVPLIKWGHASGVDWLIRRKLPSMVTALGLGHPQAKTDVQNIRGRDRGALYFQLFFTEVRYRVAVLGNSTQQRSTQLQPCWTIRTTGPSAG